VPSKMRKQVVTLSLDQLKSFFHYTGGIFHVMFL
jgi:hypothetical protein